MSIESGNIKTDEYRKLLERKASFGAKIQEFINSDGFKILKAVFYNFEQDVKNKTTYTTLEEFKADRKALEIVQGLFGELDSLVNNAEQAQEHINQLIEAESSTPSLLSLDGEGTDNEEGQ